MDSNGNLKCNFYLHFADAERAKPFDMFWQHAHIDFIDCMEFRIRTYSKQLHTIIETDGH